MALTTSLLDALKSVLREKGITYRDVSNFLELSEVSIKRIFSDKNCSLIRLEKMCELAQTDLAELLDIAESRQQQLTELSVEQENTLVSDTGLLVVAVCIINYWSFDEILAKYQFNQAQLTGLFTQLDKMEFIELLVGNRYRLKVSRRFSWKLRGPIQRFFVESVLDSYLQTGIQSAGNHFHFNWGMLSKESVDELNRKIHRVVDEYMSIVSQDVRIPVDKKLTSSLLIMFRENWEPQPFKELWK
ncbi:MAG: helix-turn-helix domain-containing protein [Cocleimonas sp.]